MKRKFYDKEGILRSEDELYLFEEDTEFYDSILAQWDRCLISDKFVERKWRNKELSATDWMLISDATYLGEPLLGSTRLQEVKVYRDALRSYNLTYTDRPEKPSWLT